MGKKKTPQEPEMNAPASPPRSKDRHLSGKLIRIPDDLHAQMKKVAELERRPLAWQVRVALEEFLRKYGLSSPSDTPPTSASTD